MVYLIVSEKDLAWEMLLLKQGLTRKKRSEESKRWSLTYSIKRLSKIGIWLLSKNQSRCRRMSFQLLKWFLRIRLFDVTKTHSESCLLQTQLIFWLASGFLSMKTMTEPTNLLMVCTRLWCRPLGSSTSKLKSLTGLSLAKSQTGKSLKKNSLNTWWVIVSSSIQAWWSLYFKERTTTQCSKKYFNSTECLLKLSLAEMLLSLTFQKRPIFCAKSTVSQALISTTWSSLKFSARSELCW